MSHSKPDAGLDDIERDLMLSKKGLKRALRRIEGSTARATFAGLKAERRDAMTTAAAAIVRQVTTLKADLKAALCLDDRTQGA